MNQWHVMKGETQHGPYTYEEVIKMIQEKVIFDFDYLWSAHLEKWTMMSDVEDFCSVQLKRVFEEKKLTTAFLQRKHVRKPIELEIYAHNNMRLWGGHTESLSMGGALVLLSNPTLIPGDEIQIHFKKYNINCVAEILGKRPTKKKIRHDTAIYYTVKFLFLSSESEQKLKKVMG